LYKVLIHFVHEIRFAASFHFCGDAAEIGNRLGREQVIEVVRIGLNGQSLEKPPDGIFW
jgi:hypothetical protein